MCCKPKLKLTQQFCTVISTTARPPFQPVITYLLVLSEPCWPHTARFFLLLHKPVFHLLFALVSTTHPLKKEKSHHYLSVWFRELCAHRVTTVCAGGGLMHSGLCAFFWANAEKQAAQKTCKPQQLHATCSHHAPDQLVSSGEKGAFGGETRADVNRDVLTG